MEAVKASHGSIVLAGLAAAIAAGMLWASLALAGGPGSSAAPPSSPGSSPVAYMGDQSIATAPQQQGGDDPDCPNMGGSSGSDGSSSGTSSSL